MNKSGNTTVLLPSARTPGIVEGFRALFYLMLPSESKYEDVSSVPNYTDAVLPCFIILILLELGIAWWKGRRTMRINDAITSLSAGVISRITLLFTTQSLGLTLYIYVYENWRLANLPWDATSTWILAFLGVDFFYYWFHRASHEVNVIWASHQTHHSSEDYNLSTALRQPFIQMYWSMWFYLIQALFIPPAIFLVHSHFNLLFQFWIHTELIDNLGPLEYILNTPSHHRVHHGRNPYCLDKNYAGTLIIWDRMFGTFEQERKEVEIAYGLVHPIQTFNPIYVQIGYYKNIFLRAMKISGFANKISVFVKGPGWNPGQPRLGNLDDLPEVESPIKQYDPKTSKLLMAYAFVHYNTMLPSYDRMMNLRLQIPAPVIVFDVIYFLGSLTCISMLFDQKPYAYILECMRCIVTVGILHFLTENYEAVHGLPSPVGSILEAFYLVSVLGWVIYFFVRPSKPKEA